MRLTQEEFIERVTNVHYGKDLDFSESVYDGSNNPVKVICKKHDKFGNIHGEFFINAGRLLLGNGCPKCNSSHLEQYVRSVLLRNNIKFEEEKKFNWLRNDKTNCKLRLDFYLPDYNIAIECQGMQHFSHEFYKYKGVEKCKEHLIDVQYRDKRKKDLCKENGVNLIYFIKKVHYKHMKNESNQVFTNLDEMLTYIQSFEKQINTDEWRLCSELL